MHIQFHCASIQWLVCDRFTQIVLGQQFFPFTWNVLKGSAVNWCVCCEMLPHGLACLLLSVRSVPGRVVLPLRYWHFSLCETKCFSPLSLWGFLLLGLVFFFFSNFDMKDFFQHWCVTLKRSRSQDDQTFL